MNVTIQDDVLYIRPVELTCPYCGAKIKYRLKIQEGVQEVRCDSLSSLKGCVSTYFVSFDVTPTNIKTYVLKEVKKQEDSE